MIKMSLNVFAKGELGEKVVNGKIKLAYPIACFDDHPLYYCCSMGTGLSYEDGRAEFWGLIGPKRVIASYRGMKIAELVKEFGHGTLAACWYAGNRYFHPSDSERKYVIEIEAKIGKRVRERILEMVPENFDEIITMLQEKGLYDIDCFEIEQEIKEGRLKPTPKIQAYLDDYHRRADDLRKRYGYVK
jgi:hypothetical protein